MQWPRLRNIEVDTCAELEPTVLEQREWNGDRNNKDGGRRKWLCEYYVLCFARLPIWWSLGVTWSVVQ